MNTLLAILLATTTLLTPAAPPSTVDTTCKSAKRPVVLVHGTVSDSKSTWAELTRELARGGWCAYALDYGNRAKDPIARSAQELSAFVDKVITQTRSSTVDIVGYSQGGLMPRHYLKFLGGTAKVNSLIGIAPPNHGTEGTIPDWIAKLCPACAEMSRGSQFLRELNAGGDLVGKVRHTTIASKLDTVVTPYTSQALTGPADRVTNVVLQDTCPGEKTPHGQLSHSAAAGRWVLNALQRGGLADPTYRAC